MRGKEIKGAVYSTWLIPPLAICISSRFKTGFDLRTLCPLNWGQTWSIFQFKHEHCFLLHTETLGPFKAAAENLGRSETLTKLTQYFCDLFSAQTILFFLFFFPFPLYAVVLSLMCLSFISLSQHNKWGILQFNNVFQRRDKHNCVCDFCHVAHSLRCVCVC